MMRLLVQRLQKRRVNDHYAAGLQNAVDFLRGVLWIRQVLENVESENAVESVVAKWEMMCVPHHVGMPENLVFELDAIRISLRRGPGADMQNEIPPFF